MVVDVDMFRPIVDFVVLGNVDCAGIVAVQCTGDGQLEILEGFV